MRGRHHLFAHVIKICEAGNLLNAPGARIVRTLTTKAHTQAADNWPGHTTNFQNLFPAQCPEDMAAHSNGKKFGHHCYLSADGQSQGVSVDLPLSCNMLGEANQPGRNIASEWGYRWKLVDKVWYHQYPIISWIKGLSISHNLNLRSRH